jgi:hybrid polyketide synthase/nonribosomal peptide synthetase ACE1
MLKNMDIQGMEMVMRPKVEGARILHERFSEPGNSSSLDFFVMFSSIVAVMGNPGQANYSAANAFLQGLTQQRCARGLAVSDIERDRI